MSVKSIRVPRISGTPLIVNTLTVPDHDNVDIALVAGYYVAAKAQDATLTVETFLSNYSLKLNDEQMAEFNAKVKCTVQTPEVESTEAYPVQPPVLEVPQIPQISVPPLNEAPEVEKVDTTVASVVESTVRAKVSRFTLCLVLLVPVAATLAYLVGQIALPALLAVALGSLATGKQLKTFLDRSILKMLATEVWVEIIVIAGIVVGTITTDGVVWQWIVTAGLIVCLLHRLVFSLQNAKEQITVIQVQVEEKTEAKV